MASTSRTASAVTLVVLFGGGLLAAFLPAALATREVRAFCAALATGAAATEVESSARARGLTVGRTAEGHVLIEHPRSMGRAWCEITLDGSGRLASKSTP